MFYVDNKSKFKMIQNDLKSFQNPKIVPELSICFVKHFFLFHLFTYLFMVCLKLCRGHSFIVWSIFILLVPALLWLSFAVGKQLTPATLPVRDSSTPDSQLLSKPSPFHVDYLSWDAGSDLIHQMNVSVQLWVSRLDGRGQISQKECVLLPHELLKGWCLLSSPAQFR